MFILHYQNTLGTLDFLWALQTNMNKVHIAAGFQIPLTQNANRFFTTDFVASEEFPTTNGFRRNPDAWLRISYPVTAKNYAEKFALALFQSTTFQKAAI
jgi:hypothetical protein